MSDLAAFDRRSQILEYLRENHRASTRALSDLFGVSEVTIRLDLQKLEEEGWLARVHGGAEIGPRLQHELPMAARELQNLEAKQRIAQAAVGFIQNGDTILIDSSTTAFHLTEFLKGYQNLTVVTNNFHVARVLSPLRGLDVVILGGSVRSETWSIVGPLAEEMIAALRIDKGFFGAAGVSLRRGLTDADIREVQIKRKMAASTQQLYALVDSTKFGKEAFSTTIPLEKVDYLITDGLPPEFAEPLNRLGVDIIIADQTQQ